MKSSMTFIRRTNCKERKIVLSNMAACLYKCTLALTIISQLQKNIYLWICRDHLKVYERTALLRWMWLSILIFCYGRHLFIDSINIDIFDIYRKNNLDKLNFPNTRMRFDNYLELSIYEHISTLSGSMSTDPLFYQNQNTQMRYKFHACHSKVCPNDPLSEQAKNDTHFRKKIKLLIIRSLSAIHIYWTIQKMLLIRQQIPWSHLYILYYWFSLEWYPLIILIYLVEIDEFVRREVAFIYLHKITKVNEYELPLFARFKN